MSALLQDRLIGDLFLSFDPDFWTGFFLLVIVCAVTALLLKKPLGRNLGGAAGYLAAAGAVSAAGVLANMALQWLLAVDSGLETNRYNGTAGIFFFLIFIALLLYHYQLIIAAAVVLDCIYGGNPGVCRCGSPYLCAPKEIRTSAAGTLPAYQYAQNLKNPLILASSKKSAFLFGNYCI